MGIIISCAKCGKSKEKSTGHYKFAIKHGKKIYCSNRCSQLDRVKPFNIVVNQQTVVSLFNYHLDGYLTWKNPTTIRTKVGQVVGHKQLFIYKTRTEYRWVVRINKKLYLLHTIIFLWHKGWIPKMLDHKDRDKLNNKIENLRPATISQNGCNKEATGISKYLGVSPTKHGKWVASIKSPHHKHHIGTYPNEKEAAKAYNDVALKCHGEFANLNIIE